MFDLKVKSCKALTVCALASTFIAGCKSTPPPTPIGQMAMREFEARNWELAIQKYTQAIAQDGARYDYYFNRGVCNKQLGRNKEAIADFIKAHNIRPSDNGSSLLELAVISLSMKDYTASIKYADQLLDEDNDNKKATDIRKKALYGRIKIALNTGQYSNALKDTEEMLSKAPSEFTYKLIKARCLFELGNDLDSRLQTDQYLGQLIKTIDKNSSESKTLQKMKAINLFHTKTPKYVRKSYETFKAYLELNKGQKPSDDDLFWAGLIAKVCLDEDKGEEYWSKLSKSYLSKRKQQLKNIK